MWVKKSYSAANCVKSQWFNHCIYNADTVKVNSSLIYILHIGEVRVTGEQSSDENA